MLKLGIYICVSFFDQYNSSVLEERASNTVSFDNRQTNYLFLYGFKHFLHKLILLP